MVDAYAVKGCCEKGEFAIELILCSYMLKNNSDIIVTLITRAKKAVPIGPEMHPNHFIHEVTWCMTPGAEAQIINLYFVSIVNIHVGCRSGSERLNKRDMRCQHVSREYIPVHRQLR